MKLSIKKSFVALLSVLMLVPATIFSACDKDGDVGAGIIGGIIETDNMEKINEFYITVTQSQERLDIVADDIYDYWFDAIYEDKYGGNISLAVYYAQQANSENLQVIETNETAIQSLYKEVRDSELKTEIKAVMSAYSDYYEFVVNVSGSFQTYKEGKETYKKELASALKELSLEL